MRCGNNMFYETDELQPCLICNIDTEIVIITEENKHNLPMVSHPVFRDGDPVSPALAQKLAEDARKASLGLA